MQCKIQRPENTIVSIKTNFSLVENEMIIQFRSPNALIPLIFTVDSGAQISLIKPNNLYKDEIVNNKEKISITGVAKGSKLITLGTININLIVNNFSLFHKFHILNNGFNLKTDGILGMDFLLKFNNKIDLWPNSKTVFTIFRKCGFTSSM